MELTDTSTRIWRTYESYMVYLVTFEVIWRYLCNYLSLASNWKAAGLGLKPTEICYSRVLVKHIWVRLNLVAFKVIFGSFGVLVLTWPLTRTRYP